MRLHSGSRTNRGVSLFCAALIATGVATQGWSADETVTGDLTIRSSSPELIFDDNSSPLQVWTIYPDATSFDIVDSTNGGTPFRIYPDLSGSNRMVLHNRGLGLGRDTPNADLHI